MGKSFKATDQNLMCREFQFEIGKTYTTEGKIKVCENGFHSCPENPLDLLEFYPATSRFWECEYGGETDKNGTKIASAEITLKFEMSLPQFVQRAIEFMLVRHDFTNTPDKATGYVGAASATGDSGAASAIYINTAAHETIVRPCIQPISQAVVRPLDPPQNNALKDLRMRVMKQDGKG